jgi:hypothetical protein
MTFEIKRKSTENAMLAAKEQVKNIHFRFICNDLYLIR